MKVNQIMSTPAITITPTTGIQDALKHMHNAKIRRLPIRDSEGRLIGIVSERDLLYASASPANSLNVWEINFLLAKLTVGEIMSKDVVAVRPDDSVEHAAELMLEHRVGGLPVINTDTTIIGIITESDIFKAYINRHKSREEMDIFMVDKLHPTA